MKKPPPPPPKDLTTITSDFEIIKKTIGFTIYLLVGNVKSGMDDGGGAQCPYIRFGFRPRSFQGALTPPPVYEC